MQFLTERKYVFQPWKYHYGYKKPKNILVIISWLKDLLILTQPYKHQGHVTVKMLTCGSKFCSPK